MKNTEGKPWVVLRSVESNSVFWTSSKKDEDPTVLADGSVAYEVIQYCDSPDEAKVVYNATVSPFALSEYIVKTFAEMHRMADEAGVKL